MTFDTFDVVAVPFRDPDETVNIVASSLIKTNSMPLMPF